MPVKIQDEGQYELFETTKGHEILVLNDEQWYSVVEGQAGEIIVLTDSDHKKRRTLQEGHFFFVDFEDDPTFRDVPHLFLQKDGAYEEAILPNRFPAQSDKQKKIIRTDDTISKDELEDYLEHPAPAGPGEARMERPKGGSLSNVVHYLKGIDLPANRREIIDYARESDAPDAVVEQLEEMSGGSYRTMADVTRTIGEAKEPLPIEDYGDLSAGEIVDRLGDLDEDELRRLKKYEGDTLGRKTILHGIDQKLELADESLPVEGYEEMTADEITDRLGDVDVDALQAMKEYEQQHRGRKTVLEAVDRQLAG